MQTGNDTHRLDGRLSRSFWVQCLSASILLGIAVVMGAFFAHTFEGKLSSEAFDIMATGNRYHFYFAISMICSALLWQHSGQRLYLTASWLFLAGILCFCGSLYLLSIRELTTLPLNWLGPVTPMGGLLFIGGCFVMCIASVKMLKR